VAVRNGRSFRSGPEHRQPCFGLTLTLNSPIGALPSRSWTKWRCSLILSKLFFDDSESFASHLAIIWLVAPINSLMRIVDVAPVLQEKSLHNFAEWTVGPFLIRRL